eukprot:gene10669-3292_t
MSGFDNSTNSNTQLTIPQFMTTYKDSIAVSEGKREKYARDYGMVNLPSEELKIDDILKENFLLQYAMKEPNEYIKKRNKILEKIKNDVDKEFVKLYKKYAVEENPPLPSNQARELAIKGASNLMQVEIIRLESMYPSKFENAAYNQVLKGQGAQRLIDFTGGNLNVKEEEE